MKKTNVYVSLTVDDKGNEREGSLRVFADNKQQAAGLLRCSPEHVKFKEQVRRTDLQRRGDHAAKMPVHSWRQRMWANIAGALALLLMTSCTSLDISGARLGVGLTRQTVTNKIDAGELGSVTESATGNGGLARVELTNKQPGYDVGLELGVGELDLEGVALDTVDVGAVFRAYLGEGSLRPYAGARLGYRAGWADVPGLGRGDRIDAATAGAFVGLDLRLSSSVSLFAEGGYEGFLGEDFSGHGPAGLFGVSISF